MMRMASVWMLVHVKVVVRVQGAARPFALGFSFGVEWLHGAKAISAGHCVVLRVSPKVVGVGVCLLEVFICSLHVMPEVVNVVLERAWKFLGGVIMP